MPLPVYPNAVRGLTFPVMKTMGFSTTVQSSPNLYTLRIANSQNPLWHFTLIYEYLKDNPLDLVPSLSPYTDYKYLQGFLLSVQGQFAEFLYDDPYDDFIGLRAQPGGSATYPSAFKTSSYPTSQWSYPLNSYIVDSGSPPHLQKVTTAGISGSTVPSWNHSGGTTSSGSMIVTDQGVFSGALAQTVPLVTDGEGNYYSPIQRNFGGQFLEDVTDLNTSAYPLSVWANGVLQTAGASGTGNYSLEGPGVAIPGYSYDGLYLQWWGAPPSTPITIMGGFYFRVRLESDQQDIEQFFQQFWTIGGSESKNGSGYLKMVSSRVPTT